MMDTSPRGDPPGFVAAPDEQTLLLPDRPGNNQVDTLQNLVSNPEVGLLFFVPGMNEMLRVSGTAEIDRSSCPTYGQVVSDQVKVMNAEETDASEEAANQVDRLW